MPNFAIVGNNGAFFPGFKSEEEAEAYKIKKGIEGKVVSLQRKVRVGLLGEDESFFGGPEMDIEEFERKYVIS